jgi:enamine deaminase RidA (YjgF/YER057c/UK114 family)
MVAAGVAVKPRTRFYLSGGTTAPIEGDMKVQALAALETLRARLAAEGMSFQDVIFLRAYVVPAANGMVDRDGWNAAYTVFFNNAAQPHKPARVTIPVVSLPEPASKIAIDLIAARP